MVERCDYYSDDEYEYEYAKYLEIEAYRENIEEQEMLEHEEMLRERGYYDK